MIFSRFWGVPLVQIGLFLQDSLLVVYIKQIEKQTRTFLVKGERQRNYKNDGKLNEIIHTLNLDLFRDFGGVSLVRPGLSLTRGRNLSGVVVISKESQHIRSPVLLPPYIVNLPRHVLTA